MGYCTTPGCTLSHCDPRTPPGANFNSSINVARYENFNIWLYEVREREKITKINKNISTPKQKYKMKSILRMINKRDKETYVPLPDNGRRYLEVSKKIDQKLNELEKLVKNSQ